MTAEEVAQFLKHNPQFFDQFPDLLESIYVPHPYGGRAIPLSERQILGLREKTRLLEGKLSELIQFGEENDAIGEKVHRLALALLAARDFSSTVHALYFHLREDFAVPHVALRVWDKTLLEGTLEGSPVGDELRRQVEAMEAPECGPAGASPYLAWFREAREHVRSVALVPLGRPKHFGMLALGSEDAERFYAEMGTLFLSRLGELTGTALAARL